MDSETEDGHGKPGIAWREFGISIYFYPFNWRLQIWHEGYTSYVRIGPFGIFTHGPS